MVKNETIPKDYGNIATNRTFLKETYIQNCRGQQDICVTDSEASVTDLSIWDEALSSDELVNWTTCRWNDSSSLNCLTIVFFNHIQF